MRWSSAITTSATPSYITNLEELNSAGVPVISINVRDISTHQPHFAPYTTVTVNGTKIGIVGYTTQSAAVGASLASTLEVADADWNSTDATKIHLASYVNELRTTQGCDLVILLTHTGHSSLATDTTVGGAATTALLVDDGTTKLPEIAVTGHWHTWAETVWQPDSLQLQDHLHRGGQLHALPRRAARRRTGNLRVVGEPRAAQLGVHARSRRAGVHRQPDHSVQRLPYPGVQRGAGLHGGRSAARRAHEVVVVGRVSLERQQHRRAVDLPTPCDGSASSCSASATSPSRSAAAFVPTSRPVR